MLGKVLYTFASLTVVFFVLSSLIIASALQCVIEDLGFFPFYILFQGLAKRVHARLLLASTSEVYGGQLHFENNDFSVHMILTFRKFVLIRSSNT